MITNRVLIMKIEDAAKLLEISGTLTKNIIRKAYKKSSYKYHPDKGGSVEMMQAINQAYEALKDFEGDIEAGTLGYSDLLNEALLKVIHLANVSIEVCGAWVWVTGDTKQYSKELGKNGAGFWWAKKKQAWYFRPSDWKSSSRGTWSLDRIRGEHGSQKVKGQYQKRLAS